MYHKLAIMKDAANVRPRCIHIRCCWEACRGSHPAEAPPFVPGCPYFFLYSLSFSAFEEGRPVVAGVFSVALILGELIVILLISNTSSSSSSSSSRSAPIVFPLRFCMLSGCEKPRISASTVTTISFFVSWLSGEIMTVPV